MNFNRAIVAGNITQEPEIRTLPSGRRVANFNVATNRRWTNSEGEQQERAEFHNIVFYGNVVDVIEKYLEKGDLVLVEGRLQTRSWEDDSGKKNYRTEIIGINLQLPPRKYKGSNNAPSAPTSDNEDEEDVPVVNEDEEIDVEEDIPF